MDASLDGISLADAGTSPADDGAARAGTSLADDRTSLADDGASRAGGGAARAGDHPRADGGRPDPAELARILFVGDVVGPLGLATVEALLPGLRAAHSIDLCVANGENAIDSGAGLDRAAAERLLAAGVDAITTGNHAYDAPGAIDLHASELPVVRPRNLAGPGCGRESLVVERDGLRLGVVNVIGSLEGAAPNPACEDAQSAVAQLAADADLILVDVHASWPAEKLAVAWVLDGRVCAVVGTHTHVPTADARLLPGGTAYVSDVGMTGARDSLIGFRPEDVVRQIRQADSPLPAPASSGAGVLMGVLITATIDGRAVAIEPLTAYADATGGEDGERLDPMRRVGLGG